MASEANSTTDGTTEPANSPTTSPLRYVHSVGLPHLLERLASTLLVTTYQAGKLALFRASNGRLSMLPRTFEKAMGLAVSKTRIAIGTQYQIWILEDNTDLAQQIEPTVSHDACYLPRQSYVTGNIHVHEMAWGEPPGEDAIPKKPDSEKELWVVNTLFSCLCTPHPKFSFVPLWHPPFVTEFAPQDRCHLSGLAMLNGRPKYVTAFAETDEPHGWRANKAKTGCVIDIDTGQSIVRGLAMPHSPRLHNGKLYVLDSGTGRVVLVNLADGHSETVVNLPGYTRGLTLIDNYAFVGLSKIRETATFGGVPIAEHRDELKCGVWVVDVTAGTVVDFLEFAQDVTEIFDVQILPGIGNPAVVGLKKDAIQGLFVLPK